MFIGRTEWKPREKFPPVCWPISPWTWLKSDIPNADKNLGKLTQTSIERYEQSSHAGSQHSFASERTAGKRIKEKARRTLETQMRADLEGISRQELPKVMLAYEPTWAIGAAGQPADPSYVQEQHAAIRRVLSSLHSAEIAADVPLLYGGSVNQQNFRSYAEIADVDGLFVGRAAWEPKSFIELIETSRQFIS